MKSFKYFITFLITFGFWYTLTSVDRGSFDIFLWEPTTSGHRIAIVTLTVFFYCLITDLLLRDARRKK